MRSFPKPAILALGAALGLQPTAEGAESPKDAKNPTAKPAKPAKPGKPEKGAKPEPPPRDKNAPMELNVPVPKGEPQKSVKFPLYGVDGLLEMQFEIGVATRVTDEDIKLQKLRIVMFKPGEDGKPVQDMDLDLPDAMLNQRTKDITSNTAVRIQCKDYDMTGNAMKFNLESRQGTLGGGVKMIIADIEHIGASKEKAKIEIKGPGAEPKTIEVTPPKEPGSKSAPKPGVKPAAKTEPNATKPAVKPAVKAEPNKPVPKK